MRPSIAITLATSLACLLSLTGPRAWAFPGHAIGVAGSDATLEVTVTGTGGNFTDTISRTLHAAAPTFGLSGMVLLYAWVGAQLDVTSTGQIIHSGNDLGVHSSQTASMLAGAITTDGQDAGHARSQSLDCPFIASRSSSPAQCPVAGVLDNQLFSIYDLPSLLNGGTIDVSGTGTAKFVGGCSNPGTSTTQGTCEDNVAFSHVATFSLTHVHAEFRYCTPGETFVESSTSTFVCPDAVAGVNSPTAATVPEPAVALLFATGATGLALRRRRQPAR